MGSSGIHKRRRYFVAVEGESEQSFVKWLQILSQPQLHIHLDTRLLGGGGYKSMLNKAVREHSKRSKSLGSYAARILILDRDRADQGDWPIATLREEAARHEIQVCVQNPNHEGLLIRMFPGKEREILDSANTLTKLKSLWPPYQKPMNASALEKKFVIDDLLRVAAVDEDISDLLKTLGFL